MTDVRRRGAVQGLGPREKREDKELSLWPYDAAGQSCVDSGTQGEPGEESDCGLRQGTPVRIKALSMETGLPTKHVFWFCKIWGVEGGWGRHTVEGERQALLISSLGGRD